MIETAAACVGFVAAVVVLVSIAVGPLLVLIVLNDGPDGVRADLKPAAPSDGDAALPFPDIHRPAAFRCCKCERVIHFIR